ncbi:MAG: ATP-binding protein [Anaerolineae bacterium]|nr:ATP-binding protein [Anaerolineae bacterium]
MKQFRPDLHSLSVQMILSSVALVLLTAVAAGLPALLLIRSGLYQQAWDQVQQGSIASLALYDARYSELESLATLTAQRPTLRELLVDGQQAELDLYLLNLQEASGLSLVVICDTARRPIGQAGDAAGAGLCREPVDTGFALLPQGTARGAWLLAAQPLADGAGVLQGMVWVGMALDDGFAAEMQAQTGLEHTLLAAGQPLATSLEGRASASVHPGGEEGRGQLDLSGRRYYASQFTLGQQGLTAEVALEVTGLSVTLRSLTWTLVASILVVIAVASVLGTFLARRIGSPLADLAEAAGAMSRSGEPGDLAEALETPLAVESRVREVSLVSQALEAARADLRRSVGELREEKIWTEHLLESIVEGIITLDRRGHITFFSHGAERITGWTRDEVVGRTCDQIFVATETDQPFSQLIPSPGRRTKIPVELRDGHHAILAVTGARLLPPARGDARVALVFRDVSEEEAVHRLLGHFLTNVAHEFRTPLSALAASVELLLDQASDLSPGELQELLTSLHLGVLGLQTLIDNLLESASIETGHFRVHPRPCSLDEIVAEAVGMMQPLLEKHGQSLVVELPAAIPMVKADPRRTVQVLINLLSNASKYGPDNAEVEIKAAVEGDWIRVSVADAGPGVPPEHRHNLFRRFVHPQPSNDKAQVGVGLGLSVVKAVVEAHGGQVGVGEGGSVFWFTLPREQGA